LPTVEWATDEENAALQQRFLADCPDTAWEHAFPLWILDQMRACSDQLPPGQELDNDTLLQWILTKPRCALH
jgi:hypothetical protein